MNKFLKVFFLRLASLIEVVARAFGIVGVFMMNLIGAIAGWLWVRGADVWNWLRIRIINAADKREFFIVFWLLIALGFLTVFVLTLAPDYISGAYENPAGAILEFKQEILALILTAFGAWIGAGSAYLFGRENFRQAVSSINDTQNSVIALLRDTKINDLSLRPLKVSVTLRGTGSRVAEHIFDNPRDWFFVLLDAQRRYVASIHEETIWRIRVDPSLTAPYEGEDIPPRQVTWESLAQRPVWQILLAAAKRQLKLESGEAWPAAPSEEDFQLIRDAFEIAETFVRDETTEAANTRFTGSERYVGVVLGVGRVPESYFTTGDIRELLLPA